uniref:Uncharacterized protein n=1 Tax=Anopheles albimanus TaxID=7167 RepID=A0A182FZK1_ANOAL
MAIVNFHQTIFAIAELISNDSFTCHFRSSFLLLRVSLLCCQQKYLTVVFI